MARDVHRAMGNCHSSAKTDIKLRHMRHVQLFPATGPLEFVVIDVLGLVPKIIKGNQHVVINRNSYSKLRRAVPTARITMTSVECILFHTCVIPYRIPSYRLTDNGK